MSQSNTQWPLRILQVVGGMNRGGTETWLMHVLRNIDRERYQIDFLVHTDQPGAYDDEIRSLGSRVILCKSPSQPWLYARNFNRVLSEYGPYDIVHSHVHHFTGFVLWLAKLAGIRGRIAHSHSDTSSEQAHAGLLRRGYRYVMQGLIRRHASEGGAASERAAGSLFGPGWKNDSRWRVLYCAIDLRPFEAPVDGAVLRRELGIPLDAFVVGHVGRFVEVKNHAHIVNVVDKLVTLHPNVYVLLVGDGPLRVEVEELVAARHLGGRVRFTGLRADVPDLMRGVMDVFLMPSHYEGLPLVLIEAQAAGLPCVCSDVITQEASIVNGLLRQVSLSLSPMHWAREVDALSGGERSAIQAFRCVQRSPFNISNGVEALIQRYNQYS